MFLKKGLFGFILISSLFFLHNFSYAQDNEQFGYLKIQYDLPGAEIFLNNKKVGITPVPILWLKTGTFHLHAYNPRRYQWGNLDWEKDITIFPFDTLIVKPVFADFLKIRTYPYNAQVFINNSYHGTTPFSEYVAIDTLSKIILKKEGYCDYHILKDHFDMNNIDVTLRPKNLESLIVSNTSFEKKMKKRYRTLSYSFGGFSILSGFTAVYFKNKADDNYDKYLQASTIQNMDKYYKSTKKYDKYSNITVGVLQGCFGLAIYYLMKSF